MIKDIALLIAISYYGGDLPYVTTTPVESYQKCIEIMNQRVLDASKLSRLNKKIYICQKTINEITDSVSVVIENWGKK